MEWKQGRREQFITSLKTSERKKDKGDQEQEGNKDGEEQKEGDSDKESESGEQSGSEGGEDENQPTQPRPGEIQPEEAARILDMLERSEATLRAKLQAQENAKRRKANRQKIEKDW